MERRAILGMQSLGRELTARHAAEINQHAADTLEMLREIASTHGLPDDAFVTDWGIDMAAMAIVRMDGTSPATEIGE